MVYHSQTNKRVERFNRTTAAHLQHYVAEHHTNWDQFGQSLAYAYIAKVHKSAGMTPFSLVLARQAPGKTTSSPSTPIPNEMLHPLDPLLFHSCFVRQIDVLKKQTDAKLKTAEGRYDRGFD